ncbi:MAG: FG-GAP repeat protein, partial [Phycisphaerales bacterium]
MTSNTHRMTVTMTAMIGLTLGLAAPAALGQPGWVLSHQKISDTEGGFTGILDDEEQFSNSVASLGDLDGDGVGDLAVGAHWDDDGGGSYTERGAVWVLFLNPNGTVKSHQKISATQGGIPGILDEGDHFGASVASLGDLDGDGVGDMAVGASLDDDGGENRGAVWVLFLNPNGTVKSHQKISDTEGGFTGILDDGD